MTTNSVSSSMWISAFFFSSCCFIHFALSSWWQSFMTWLLMTLESDTSNQTCALLPAATWTSLHPFFTFFPCWKFISVSRPHQSGHNLPPPHCWRDLPFPSEVVLDHSLRHLHPHFSPCPPARSTAAASPPPSASYSQSWHKPPTESD